MRGMRHGEFVPPSGIELHDAQAGGGGRGMEDVEAGRNARERGRGRKERGDRDTARGTRREEAAAGLQLRQRESERVCLLRQHSSSLSIAVVDDSRTMDVTTRVNEGGRVGGCGGGRLSPPAHHAVHPAEYAQFENSQELNADMMGRDRERERGRERERKHLSPKRAAELDAQQALH